MRSLWPVTRAQEALAEALRQAEFDPRELENVGKSASSPCGLRPENSNMLPDDLAALARPLRRRCPAIDAGEEELAEKEAGPHGGGSRLFARRLPP